MTNRRQQVPYIAPSYIHDNSPCVLSSVLLLASRGGRWTILAAGLAATSELNEMCSFEEGAKTGKRAFLRIWFRHPFPFSLSKYFFFTKYQIIV